MKLRIRAYNVEFGDAILISFPDAGVTRHILLDVGNKHGGKGGNKVFIPVIDAIAKAIAPATNIDLYVMTHEHLDHVEGLAEYKNKKGALPFAIDRVWMTRSADPDYYKDFPDAVRAKEKKKTLYRALASLAAARGLDKTGDRASHVRALLENNDPDMTDKCVSFLRTLAPGKTHYVHRGMDVSKLHPFKDAKITIWAPEEDSTVYYSPKKKKKDTPHAALEELEEEAAKTFGDTPRPLPIAGVDASAFYNLVERRELSLMEGLFSIDAAENDTSVVFCLEWAKKKLLFVGDAEQKSWSMMDAKGVLEKVDFLKIGHHGSHNATPPDALLQKILPKAGKAKAVLSTCEGGYPSVPDGSTRKRIETRATVKSTEEVEIGKWVDVEMDAGP